MTIQEQWGVASGVGVTALAVAATRAIETSRERPLVRDPFAEHFVRATGMSMPTSFASDAELSETDRVWAAEADYMGLRTRFFDDYFHRATAEGTRQVVILASGLDSRPYRMNWPQDTLLFEIDQPKVLAFKDEVLAKQNAQARCRHRAIGTDLRGDWEDRLVDAGLDPREPTAWLAEGILPYLPPQAECQLLDAIGRLSAPGSRLALETPTDTATLIHQPNFGRVLRPWGIDLRTLIHVDDRPAVAESLRGQGWTVAEELSGVTATRYGRPIGWMRDSARFVTAEHVIDW